MTRRDDERADRVAAAEAKRRELNDAAIAKLMAEQGDPDWERGQESTRQLADRPVGAAAITCPHCQTQGRVTSRRVKVKRGISGGKATGAILTSGLSMLATGLSRKETVTQARCGACGVEWTIS